MSLKMFVPTVFKKLHVLTKPVTALRHFATVHRLEVPSLTAALERHKARTTSQAKLSARSSVKLNRLPVSEVEMECKMEHEPDMFTLMPPLKPVNPASVAHQLKMLNGKQSAKRKLARANEGGKCFQDQPEKEKQRVKPRDETRARLKPISLACATPQWSQHSATYLLATQRVDNSSANNSRYEEPRGGFKPQNVPSSANSEKKPVKRLTPNPPIPTSHILKEHRDRASDLDRRAREEYSRESATAQLMNYMQQKRAY